MMLLYTDGISDAINRENKMFGLQGILRTICNMPNQSVSDMGDGLFKDVTKHQGDLPQFDDMTIAGKMTLSRVVAIFRDRTHGPNFICDVRPIRLSASFKISIAKPGCGPSSIWYGGKFAA